MVLTRVSVLAIGTASLVLAPSVVTAQAQPGGDYTLNRAASAVGFTISGSMLFKVKRDGNFTDFTGNLSYNPAHPTDAHVDLTVYTNSVDMHNTEHDQLLKSPGFFDTAHFPTMHFVSASTIRMPDGSFSMTGDMTIRGVTKRLTIPVKMHPDSTSAGESGAIFESNFQIDRTDFGLNGVPKWGGMSVSISKKVDIHIAIAANMGGATGR
jgi:polyisoprenoid-binding protein YceI